MKTLKVKKKSVLNFSVALQVSEGAKTQPDY